jgi:hypothetical protein
VRALTALLVLRDKVIKPLLAAARQNRRRPPTGNLTTVDQHYHTLYHVEAFCRTRNRGMTDIDNSFYIFRR